MQGNTRSPSTLSRTFTFIFTKTLLLIHSTFAPKDISFSKGSKFLMYCTSKKKKKKRRWFEGLQLWAGVDISLNSKYFVNLSVMQSQKKKITQQILVHGKNKLCPRKTEGWGKRSDAAWVLCGAATVLSDLRVPGMLFLTSHQANSFTCYMHALISAWRMAALWHFLFRTMFFFILPFSVSSCMSPLCSFQAAAVCASVCPCMSVSI